jgi:hypothetical protein
MANEFAVNQADLTSVADAIREKTGESDSLVFPVGFVSAMDNLALSKNFHLLVDEKITIASAITMNQKVDLFQSDELKNLTTDYEKGDYEIGMIGPKEKVVTRGYYSLYYRGYNNSWNSNSSERLSIDESGTVKLSTGNVLSVNAQDVYLYVLAIKEA